MMGIPHPRTAVLVLLAAMATLAAPRPAAAQQVQAGQLVTGEITDTDRRLDDDSHFDEYVYRGQRGERLVITMRSDAFDAYLYLGRITDGSWEMLTTDDDSGGGTDARITFTLPADGDYLIRANAFHSHGRGPYTLLVESSPGYAPAPANVAPGRIAPGQTVSGRLEPGDLVLGDGSYFDEYVFAARRGDLVVIIMRSADFDAFLHLGTGHGDAWETLEVDDDGAGGTDALITFTIPANGEYVIRANSLRADETGAYTLELR